LLTLAIAPAFYQTIWFRALYIAAAIALLRLAYVIRLRQVIVRTRIRTQERERIARDLHDTFFQAIQGLLLTIDNITNKMHADEPTRGLLKDALKRSDQVMAEGRELVLDLRAEAGSGEHLSAALTAVGNEFKEAYSADFNIIVTGSAITLRPIVFEEVYRVSREAIFNAFRHAKAKLVEVEILYRRTELRVHVRDDGSGIDAKILRAGGRPEHWGLPGMKERARKIGATLISGAELTSVQKSN
jgi:signal transduction histidine kinase